MEMERVAKLWPMASWEGELYPWAPLTGVAVCPKAMMFRRDTCQALGVG